MDDKLEREERELLESYERGEWQSVQDVESGKVAYAHFARQNFLKDKRINIRISGRDLALLKAKSLEEGIPYQTLIASILHKYATGRLVEKG